MPQNVAAQLVGSLYVYDLDMLAYNIELAEKNANAIPMFSFMPLNGGRPARILNLPTRPIEKEEKSQKKDKVKEEEKETKVQEANKVQVVDIKKEEKKPRKKVVKPEPVDPSDPRQVRSSMFRQGDYVPQKDQDEGITPDKEAILRSLGITTLQDGSDEGVNQRINNSVGRNLNQTVQRKQQNNSNELTAEQFELLRKIGAAPQEEVVIKENIAVDENGNEVRIDDPSLAELPPQDNGILTEEQLQRLKDEFAQEQEALGVQIGDSSPGESIAIQSNVPTKQTKTLKRI
jgi:hypothetical protein